MWRKTLKLSGIVFHTSCNSNVLPWLIHMFIYSYGDTKRCLFICLLINEIFLAVQKKQKKMLFLRSFLFLFLWKIVFFNFTQVTTETSAFRLKKGLLKLFFILKIRPVCFTTSNGGIYKYIYIYRSLFVFGLYSDFLLISFFFLRSLNIFGLWSTFFKFFLEINKYTNMDQY